MENAILNITSYKQDSALRLLKLHQDKFVRAVIFSDSKAAGSTETVISTEAKNCQVLLRQTKAKHKQTAL